MRIGNRLGGSAIWAFVAVLGVSAGAQAAERVTKLPLGGPLDGDLVLVEAVVHDRNGRAVAGLTQDDFVLVVSGRETPIDAFAATCPKNGVSPDPRSIEDPEGDTVVVPDMGAHGTHMAFVNADGDPGDIDVRVMKMDGVHENIDIEVMGDGAHMMQAHHPDGVTIISATPLDDSVKESIRSVLISAGNNEEVTFIDGSGDGKQVHVIKKHIEIQ